MPCKQRYYVGGSHLFGIALDGYEAAGALLTVWQAGRIALTALDAAIERIGTSP